MSYYAKAPDRLQRYPGEGFVEITKEQYKKAIDVLSDIEDNREIAFINGEFQLIPCLSVMEKAGVIASYERAEEQRVLDYLEKYKD